MSIFELRNQSLKEIDESKDLKSLDLAYRKYLGRKGEITKILRALSDLPKEKRAEMGKAANELKKELEEKIKEKSASFKTLPQRSKIDVTAPGAKLPKGHLHPLTLVRQKVEEIFGSLGFEIVEGPDIETEYYNFDALNIPPDHPAREMWDTFWLHGNQNARSNDRAVSVGNGLLLKTHTSPMQIRYMETHQPPFRIIVPGRCFRYEATDASHSHTFYQIEGLMVGKDISLANLKGVMEAFVKEFFSKETEIRWRPGYFPFVEPGLEADISCQVCKGKGCSVCQKTGWLEMMGAGMVHPNVLKNSGVNPKFWQGFAFGMGLDRIAMMKYKINDIRLLYSGDIRFLRQF